MGLHLVNTLICHLQFHTSQFFIELLWWQLSWRSVIRAAFPYHRPRLYGQDQRWEKCTSTQDTSIFAGFLSFQFEFVGKFKPIKFMFFVLFLAYSKPCSPFQLGRGWIYFWYLFDRPYKKCWAFQTEVFLDNMYYM